MGYLLIYRGCSAKAYEYLDYTNIESFYVPLPEKELEYYRDKYSNERETFELLRKYALLLREYGPDVLNGNLDILKKVRQLREKNDQEHDTNTFYSL